jgi:hypothetical protein
LAYIGNIPTSATFAIDTFSGDNSTVNFTLREAPVATSSLMIFVGGIRQQIESYSLSGTTLTFSEAPPTGSSNIQVVFLGLGASSTVPSDGSVSGVKLTTGAVTGDKIGLTAINANNIVNTSITGNKIASAAITGDKIGLTAITSNLIASAAITGDKIGLTAINANNIVDATITNAKLASPGATTGKVIALAIVMGF